MTKYREIIRLAGLGLSQTNIALSCNCIKDNCQQSAKGSERTEPHMAIGSKTNRSSPLWIAFPEPESQSHYIQGGCQIMPTSARNFSATECKQPLSADSRATFPGQSGHIKRTVRGNMFFVKYFSLKKASKFPFFSKGFSLPSAGIMHPCA